MARAAKPRRSPRAAAAVPDPPPADDRAAPLPGTTGRYLVLFAPGSAGASAAMLHRVAGLRVASSSDIRAEDAADALDGADALMLADLGVAVVDAPPDQIRSLNATESTGILAVEAERVVHAISSGAPSLSLEYLGGYRDAVNHLYDKLASGAGVTAEAMPSFPEAEMTWGLQAIGVPASRLSGRGVRVAVLDTGFDLGHPDFAGRNVTSQSFIAGQAVQDGNGHGTHCIGTSCGPRRPGTLPRYGIAFEADILAGKVLSNEGSGADGGILAGIQWAVTNRCAIVSMSLGAPVQVGQPFSQIFEQVARRAVAAGTVIIAAAGNDSRRPQSIAPVSHPANCPSIMAVAALDKRMQVAFFSNGGINAQGGQVDIAGPGLDVRSSWPRPTLYKVDSGTSMATPHVAGVAALLAEANPGSRGGALSNLLTQTARRLSGSSRDIGAGLVQAP